MGGKKKTYITVRVLPLNLPKVVQYVCTTTLKNRHCGYIKPHYLLCIYKFELTRHFGTTSWPLANCWLKSIGVRRPLGILWSFFRESRNNWKNAFKGVSRCSLFSNNFSWCAFKPRNEKKNKLSIPAYKIGCTFSCNYQNYATPLRNAAHTCWQVKVHIKFACFLIIMKFFLKFLFIYLFELLTQPAE